MKTELIAETLLLVFFTCNSVMGVLIKPLLRKGSAKLIKPTYHLIHPTKLGFGLTVFAMDWPRYSFSPAVTCA